MADLTSVATPRAGAFFVIRPAWNIMRNSGYARVVKHLLSRGPGDEMAELYSAIMVDPAS